MTVRLTAARIIKNGDIIHRFFSSFLSHVDKYVVCTILCRLSAIQTHVTCLLVKKAVRDADVVDGK